MIEDVNVCIKTYKMTVGTKMAVMTAVPVANMVIPTGKAGVMSKMNATKIMATITEIKAMSKSHRMFITLMSPDTAVLYTVTVTKTDVRAIAVILERASLT